MIRVQIPPTGALSPFSDNQSIFAFMESIYNSHQYWRRLDAHGQLLFGVMWILAVLFHRSIFGSVPRNRKGESPPLILLMMLMSLLMLPSPLLILLLWLLLLPPLPRMVVVDIVTINAVTAMDEIMNAYSRNYQHVHPLLGTGKLRQGGNFECDCGMVVMLVLLPSTHGHDSCGHRSSAACPLCL